MTSLRGFLKDYIRENYEVQDIVNRYTEWVSEATYMILTRWNRSKAKNDVYAVKCAKRGNDVYRSRVENRFRGLSKRTEEMSFFNPKDRGEKHTCALWVTLTYDTKLRQYKEAWKEIGIEFNAFMSLVRRNFGRVSCCRVFESFENGYPHIHCILLFEKYSFSVFRDSNGKFRVHEKSTIARGWHSHVDVEAMSSVAGGLSYLKKYLLKGINFEKADCKGVKTLALCWVYRKRAFAVSGEFRSMLAEYISHLHSSNKELKQVTLSGQVIVEEKFCLLGFVTSEDIKIDIACWFALLTSSQIDLLNEHLEQRGCY